ncbi:MAG: TrkH family potassium uptake protein [Verrucomicrobia bacterium]|nr:TrkH family potassium uptake protein [Verrucomicrobiota bacterium]
MFDFKEISRLLSRYLAAFSLLLTFPLGVAAYYEFFAEASVHPQPHSTAAFIWTLALCILVSALLWLGGRKSSGYIERRESILLVVSIWIFTSILSALPFYFSRTLTNPIDAYFEAMSGLTTTGSTMISPKSYNPATGEEIVTYYTNPHVPNKTYILKGTVAPVRDPETGLALYTGVEAVSKAILLWRSFLQWLGGMGIVVIFLMVLPALGVGGKFLYQMEITGPIKEGISPRVKETCSKLWKLYLFFTVLEVALLVWTHRDMPFFDAVCISFANISTGGFSVRNDSIASYNSLTTDWIVLIFMILGSINFSLYFHILRLKFFRIYVPDFFLFLFTAALGCILVSFFLVGEPISSFNPDSQVYSWGEALQQGSFQAISVQTSTGFFTANYDRWPFASQMFMLLLMFIGGMSGSTAGGIKTSRFYILYKIGLHRLESLYRPDSVRKLKIGASEIDDKNALTVLAFFCIVAFFTVLGAVSLILDGIDPETSLGLIASLLNNVGTAFRAAGPTDSLSFLSPFSKILATFWMLLGRLEYYVVLILFLPTFWKSH